MKLRARRHLREASRRNGSGARSVRHQFMRPVLYRPEKVLTCDCGLPGGWTGMADRDRGHGRGIDRAGAHARGAAGPGAAGAGRTGRQPPARPGQRPGRHEPGRGGAGRGHGPADAAGLGAPLQRRGRRRPARPAARGTAVPPGRGPAGDAQGADPQGPEARARRLRGLARPRPARPGRAPLRGALQRDRDAEAAARARPLLAEGAAGPPRGRPEGAGALQKNLPALIREVAARHPEAARVELWFMDEARIGQKGGVTHVWHAKGVRPRGVRQQGFASAHLFGAVCPGREVGVALVLPEVSTAAMGVFLAELSRAVPAGTQAVLVLDGAGWHVSEDLAVPADPTLVHPPPYSPELNPVERVWEHLRDRWLSHRVLAGGYEAVVDAACAAWNALLAEPGRLRSLTSFPWLPPAVSTS